MKERKLLTEFQIAWDTIRAITPFASKDRYRCVLTGVRFERRKAFANVVACDGRALAAIKENIVDEYYEGPIDFIIPVDILRRVPCSKIGSVTITIESESTYRIATIHSPLGISIGGRCIEETTEKKYPDWRKVVPTDEPETLVKACVDVNQLAKFQSAARLLNYGKAVKLWQGKDKMGPFFVDIGVKNFTGVLMPYRWPSETYSPQFFPLND